jgi:uncharacterized repeat protein (TIGR03803 family)
MSMARFNVSKELCVIFVVFAATAIPSPGQNFNTLASFNGANGWAPTASLIQGPDGDYYGTTQLGGPTSSASGGVCAFCGAIFRFSSTGALTSLHSFCVTQVFDCPDGALPNGVMLATDGNFYGTTQKGGGNFGGGTIFTYMPSGRLYALYSFCPATFCGGGGGASPTAGLVQAVDGEFYGTTYEGGKGSCSSGAGCGTIFKITSTGIMTVLYTFSDETEGNGPYAGLVQATDGNFYGTTVHGGFGHCPEPNVGCGTVFRITRQGKLTYLHSFSGTKGAYPEATLLQALDGNLYGTTAGGANTNDICNGVGGCGTVFRIAPTGEFTMLYAFCSQAGCADGADPQGGLIQGTDGNLYGTTTYGGANDDGTMFEITPTGTLTTLYSFCSESNCDDGSQPWSGLLQGTDGTFYGTTTAGGTSSNCSGFQTPGCGTVFSLSNSLGPFVSFVPAAGKIGSKVGILGTALTGTSSVSLDGIPADFSVVLPTFIVTHVPSGATTGYVTVTTPTGVLTSNVPFHVIP